jgi:hypothetical protein
VELESLRWVRRAASAAVSLSAIALVMAKTRGPSETEGDAVGLWASLGLFVSLVVLVLAWRKEHAANEAAFAARERAQLAALRLQAELARRHANKTRNAEASAPGSREPPSGLAS